MGFASAHNNMAYASEFDEGLAHLAEHRWDAAVVSLRVALSREPGRFAITRALVTAYLKSGDIPSARSAASSFTMNYPMCAEGWRLAGQLEYKLNDYPGAIKLLQRGLDHLPSSDILKRQLALFQSVTGNQHQGSSNSIPTDLQAASDPDWLDRAAQDPRLLESLLNLPTEDTDIEMLRQLESKLARLLESQQYHADRQLMLARLQNKIGDAAAAMLSVQRALRANPDYVEAHRLRATLSAGAGDFDGAIEILEALIARGCDWPDVHYQIAELQRQRGKAEAARSHLYSAIRLNPRFEQAKQLLERCAA